MNRLDAMILRVSAQRAALDWAMARIANRAGDALEVGLGNGRTYDHMREHMPERRIWVIERVLKPHPSCMPPEADLLLGDAGDGLRRLSGAGLLLINYDLVAMGGAADDAQTERLTPLLRDALALKGGYIVSTQALADERGLQRADAPAEVGAGGAFIYERRA